MVNQCSYCRTRLIKTYFKLICLDKPTLGAVGLIKKRGSINDMIINRRLIEIYDDDMKCTLFLRYY